jgi:hypothetical protein
MSHAHLSENLEIVQNEPELPDFDISLIEPDPDEDLLSDPCLGGCEF